MHDPKMWLSLVGVMISVIALWRVDVRNRQERHQKLLDRADEWLKKLYACLGTGTKTQQAIAKIRELCPEGDHKYVSLELDRYIRNFDQIWDWTGPTLPAGPITTALKDGAEQCRLLHHETMALRVSDRVMTCAQQLAKAHELIERERGKW